MPISIPTIFVEISGSAINKIPAMQNSTDTTMYPILAIFIGATERIFMDYEPPLMILLSV
jgi:hypothetical protein